MANFNTGNPVPSADVRDLHDNAVNLDEGINGPAGSWRDRKGAMRRSWAGLEAEYDQFIADNGLKRYASWAALEADTSRPDGFAADVIGDGGTHVDPFSGATVSNSGQYRSTGGQWLWMRADVLAEKLDSSEVPHVQEQVRESIGISSVVSTTGGGSAECIRDAAGNLRVVSDYPGQGVGDPVFHGNVPRAWTAPAFGYDTLIESAAGSDPDRIELIRDVSGALRVMMVLGAQSAGPVFYGGNAAEARSVPTEYVIFLIAGQSNAQGIGNPTLSPQIPAGVAFQYYAGALTAVTADPIGNADKASAWAAFANEFYARTGMGVIFVPAAVGNSALTAAAAHPDVGGNWQNWDATGSLRGAAATALAAAFGAATSQGLAWRFGGVLWSQGERDSHCLPNAETYPGVITEAAYLSAFEGLMTYLNNQIGSSKWPFLMSQTGGDAQGVDAAALASMRNLQRTIAGSHAQVRLAWTGAFNLIERGLMRAKDFPGDAPDRNRNHYSQQGYNEMGRALAVVAAVASI